MNTVLAAILAVLLLALGTANAQIIKVEEISNFAVEISMKGDEVHAKNVITIKNLIDKPLVPGIGEIRLQKKAPKKLLVFQIPFTEEVSPVKINNLRVYTENGKKISAKVVKRKEYTAIIYEIWYPIEPKGELTFIVEYSSPDLVESGIFFKEISIPIGTDTDIRKIDVKISTDLNTVYKDFPETAIPAGSLIFYNAELSPIPLPNIGVRWANIFWSMLLLITALVSIAIVKRKK